MTPGPEYHRPSMRRSFLALLFCFTVPASTQSDDTDPLLGRIRLHAAETLANTPDYTCLETIGRTQHAARRDDLDVSDKVRLQLAVVDRKEQFAWPGAAEFDERPRFLVWSRMETSRSL